MKETEQRPKILLEDLLHLKRAERPPAEFWTEFERELRSKQLAAIVEVRRSWRDWLLRKSVAVPLGAAAALAMAFGSYRGMRSESAPVAPSLPSVEVATAVDTSAPTREILPAAPAQYVAEKPAPEPIAVAAVVPTSQPVAKTAEVAESSMTLVASETPELPAAGLVASVAAESNSEAVEPANTDFAGSMEHALNEWVKVASGDGDRRSRLLAQVVSLDPHAADSSDAVRSRERITRRINEDALYDSISRLGLGADRVSIKF